jgi:hypothetical protein
MITEISGHGGFYDSLLDIARMHLVPNLWLDVHPNYNSLPVGKYGLQSEDICHKSFGCWMESRIVYVSTSQ